MGSVTGEGFAVCSLMFHAVTTSGQHPVPRLTVLRYRLSWSPNTRYELPGQTLTLFPLPATYCNTLSRIVQSQWWQRFTGPICIPTHKLLACVKGSTLCCGAFLCMVRQRRVSMVRWLLLLDMPVR